MGQVLPLLSKQQKQSIGIAIGLGMLKNMLIKGIINKEEYDKMTQEYEQEFIRVYP